MLCGNFGRGFLCVKVSKIAADNIAITPPAVSITAPAAEAPQEQPPPNSAENASAANSIAKNSIFENSIAENSIVETKIRNDLPKPEHDSVTTLPAAAEIAPLPEQIAAQPMAANFSVNGKSLSSFQTGIIRLNREEWPTYAADLHVENNGNITWDNPQIRIVFSDNWEKKYTETKSLPSVAPGKTADFSIPVGTYPVTKHDDT